MYIFVDFAEYANLGECWQNTIESRFINYLVCSS